jgi:hypothetical protein
MAGLSGVSRRPARLPYRLARMAGGYGVAVADAITADSLSMLTMAINGNNRQWPAYRISDLVYLIFFLRRKRRL